MPMRLLTRDRSFYRQFFSLLVFIALQNLVSFSVSLADNVMLGRYSQDALSGVALANQVQFLLQMIVGSAGEGVVVLAAQYWGAQNARPIPEITAIGMRVALAMGLAFLLAVTVAPEGILYLLCKETVVVEQGAAYLRVIRYTYPIFCLSTVLLAAMRSVENVRVGFVVMLSSLFINMGLNYCLIFGHFGFPEMGVRGAAIATLIARAFELAAACVFAFGMDKKLRLRPRALLKFNRALWADYVKYATPVMLAGASWGMAMFVQTGIIGRLGDNTVAANSIAGSLFGVISVFAYGAGNAAGVFTGKLVGEGNMEKLKESVRSMQILFLMIGLVSGLGIFLAREPIIALYDLKIEETRVLARQFITVLCFTVVGSAYQAPCLTGIVRGGGHTKFVFYNDLIFQWCVVLGLSFLAAFVWKLSPVWVFLCLKSDQLLKCAVAVVEVNRYRWIHRLTR